MSGLLRLDAIHYAATYSMLPSSQLLLTHGSTHGTIKYQLFFPHFVRTVPVVEMTAAGWYPTCLVWAGSGP